MNATVLRPLPLVLGGVIALAAAIGVGRFVYTPILPPMVEGLDLTKSEAGLIASANFLGYLLGALAASAPRLPGSRRSWLIASLAISALTTGAMGLTSSMTLFLVLRFVGGVVSAFVLVFASVLVLDRLVAAGRGSLSALHFAGVGLGIAVSAALVSLLLGVGSDWRGLWLASGGLALFAVVAVALLVPDRGADGQATRAEKPQGNRRALASLITAYGLFGFGYVITATFLVAIVRDAPEISPLEPLIWIIVGLAGAPSVLFWGKVGARIGIPQAFVVACLVEAVGVAASVLWVSAVGVILAGVLLGGTFMGITALGLIEGRRLASGDPRRILALMTAAFGLGQIIGPTFAGVLFDMTESFFLPSIAAAGALVVAAALVGWINTRPATAGAA